MTDSVETRTIRSGDILKEKYMQKQDTKKIKKYTDEANKLLDDFVKEIESLIEKGKPPVATRNTAQSTSGILVNNNELENMIKDFLFSIIMADEADKRNLKVDLQAQPVGIDQKTRQPVIGLVIACTFK